MSLWNCIFIGLRFALMRHFTAVLLVPTLKIKDFIHMYKIWISNMRGFSHNFGCSEIIDFSLDLTSMTRWCSSFSSSPVPITYTREEPWTTFAVSVRVLAARLSLNCSWNCVHLKTGVWFLVFRQGWQIYNLKPQSFLKLLIWDTSRHALPVFVLESLFLISISLVRFSFSHFVIALLRGAWAQ